LENTTYIVLSRLVAQQRAMDVTAANIANSSTPGFRGERMLFSDWIDRQTNTDQPQGGRNILFTQDRASYREQQQGAVQHTANPFDLAIGAQEGYFTVLTAQGPRLTRAGRFTPSATGQLVDDAGNPVLSNTGQPIAIPAGDTEIEIAGDGTISSGQTGQLGKIGVVQPADPNRLVAEGGTTFRADTPTSPVLLPGVQQGALEDSNVQPVLETTRMINDLREFQFVVQFVQAESDRQQNVIDKLAQKPTT
jgi:flagellar basal-body rod protein FlgF